MMKIRSGPYRRTRPQIRVFACPVCGTRNVATKVAAITNPGHIKTMYCYGCRTETEQTQIE